MNIQSEGEIMKCQAWSIRTEDHFGDIKENETFRAQKVSILRDCLLLVCQKLKIGIN